MQLAVYIYRFRTLGEVLVDCKTCSQNEVKGTTSSHDIALRLAHGYWQLPDKQLAQNMVHICALLDLL